MRALRLLATIAAAIVLLLPMLAGGALAQYATGLPQGVVAAEVDGQPIDAANKPTTTDPSPTIAGRINSGQPVVDIGIGNGEIMRFQAEADAKGRFKSKPPAPLAPGEYGLYLFDALVGNFVVSGDETMPDEQGNQRKGSATDVARLVPFPADFYGIYPDLGLLDGRYFTADDMALAAAAAAGAVTEETLATAKADLKDAGWVQRYESRLAVPDPDQRTQFVVQANSYVIEYKDEASAQAAFGASLTGNDLRPDIAVGLQSELTRIEGTTPDTGVNYIALRNVFQQGRFVCVTVLADLSGGEPSQDAILSAALTVAARVGQIESGEVTGIAPKALRIDLPGTVSAARDESYQAIDGQLVPLFNESKKSLAAREAAFTGTYEDYVGAVTGSVEGDAPLAFAYGSTISAFPAPENADAWLAGLPDLIANDPLTGYASFDPVPDAPVAGEASATYAVSRKNDDATLNGYRVYIRVGAEVAILEFASDANPTLEDLQPLIDAQVACLEAGACETMGELPGAKGIRSGPAESEPAVAATPEAETAEPGVIEIGAEATEPAAVRPAEPDTSPAEPASSEPPTAEPAVRRADSGSDDEKKDKEKKKDRAPVTPAPAVAPAAPDVEPTPTWSGGVRDVTPSSEVTGG